MSVQGVRTLVTGGAGFIGSHIVESLLQEGAKVTVYDDFSSGLMENLANVKDDVEIIKGDILNYESLLKSMQRITIVSHQAAQLEIAKCIEDPLADLQVNTVGTLNVLKAALESGVERVVCASSACVYGQAQAIPQSESHPTNPNWPYGVSKLAAEKYCRLFSEYYGMSCVSLRYGIVYGPREWFGRVITMFIRQVMQGKPPVIFGDGKQSRDFIYVSDVVAMHNRCLVDAHDGEYNVGTGIRTTIAELARIIIDVSGKVLEPIYEDVPEGTFSRFVPQRRRTQAELREMVLDSSKAKEAIGWSPKVGLRDGLIQEYVWALENLHRWKAGDVIRV